MLLHVLEVFLLLLILLVLITQILIPLFRGTPVFPIFRYEAKLDNSLSEVKQKAIEKKLEKNINNLRKKERV